MTVLTLDHLSIRYGTTLAVDSLSLEVHSGEVLGLLGPNGCGKSSTLAAISGGVPFSGQIRVLGRTLAESSLEYRRHLGLVPQELALFEELTAEQNLQFFGRLYALTGSVFRHRVAEILDFVHLTEQARRPVRTFSGGMKRRLNIGCALLHQPALLLLDEPTVGIDIQSREAIFASLHLLRSRGTAMVFTTHHLDEAERLCDRIAILDQGRLLTCGTLAELAESGPRWRASGPHGMRSPHGCLESVFLELTGRSLREP